VDREWGVGSGEWGVGKWRVAKLREQWRQGEK